MVNWAAEYTNAARRDARKLTRAGLSERAHKLISSILDDPKRPPPPLEKLVGDLAGLYSRRLNLKHRIVYEVDDTSGTIIFHRMFTHYE